MINSTRECMNMMTVVQTDFKLNMKDVIDVFLYKYEDSLHIKRALLQEELITVNSSIKELTNKVIKDVKSLLQSSNTLRSVNLGLITVTTQLDDSMTLDWDKSHVNYCLDLNIKSNLVGCNYQTNECIGGVELISSVNYDEYQSLMTTKTYLTNKLVVINDNLHNIERKERQIKRLLTEKKLQEIGMGELLNDPSLLTIINDPI